MGFTIFIGCPCDPKGTRVCEACGFSGTGGTWECVGRVGLLGRGGSPSKGKEKIWRGCVVELAKAGEYARTCMCACVPACRCV